MSILVSPGMKFPAATETEREDSEADEEFVVISDNEIPEH